MAVWIVRLLCPEGHVMAAGTAEADREDEPLLARSFVNFLSIESPVMTCEEGCYEIDLRTDCADLNVHVEEVPSQMLKEAVDSLRNEAQRIRVQAFLHRSRN